VSTVQRSPAGCRRAASGAAAVHRCEQPAASSSPPPGNTGTNSGSGSGAVTPEVAAQIKQAKDIRQNLALATPDEGGNAQTPDQGAVAAAYAAATCQGKDPLIGNDDPNLPLVTCDQQGTYKYLLGKQFLKGTNITGANASPNTQGAGYQVNLTFDGTGSDIWAKFTAANIQKQAAFVLDTAVVSAPTIQGAIPGGNTQITGQFNQKTATDLANVLKYGSLPLSFDPGEAETVSATLGLTSLRAGLIAGAIGLGLVFIYACSTTGCSACSPCCRCSCRSAWCTRSWCCSAGPWATAWTCPVSPV